METVTMSGVIGMMEGRPQDLDAERSQHSSLVWVSLSRAYGRWRDVS